ncbi:MAG: hypothetical protein A2Z97_13095 [Bdellovibrionales bacterium GWB1_52_6]|nr:MAG: hypothetical protein A2Z97_13095 [Bdellovibrionales bacterium GWB1_52_6]OFZ05768.1 MAG: hypothetical protein A2X97_03645 [Bdellovibrionales bacterium GWA1_52_35]
MKFLAFASICFVSLLPSVFIGYFQQLNYAKENIEQLSVHLTTLRLMAQEGLLSPQAAVSTTQNNKLVIWCSFFEGELVSARAGLTPQPGVERRLQLIWIDPERKISQQLPAPDLLNRATGDYKLRIPLVESKGRESALELGLSYAPLYSVLEDQLALSTVLFITAFIFLFGAVLFIDSSISKITNRIIRAIRTENNEGLAIDLEMAEGLYAPTYNALMEALEVREDQLLDTRDTLESVFDGLQIGVSMISTEMRLVIVNRRLMDLLGEFDDKARFISEPASLLNFSGQKPPVEELLRRALKSLRYEYQDVEQTRKSEKRYFVQEVYPLFGEDRKPVAFIFQCRDVTPERLAQLTVQNFNMELQKQLDFQKAQLEETHQRLLQASRLAAIGELAGGVAHEINNPNGVILAGAKYVLNRVQGDATVPEYIFKYLERIVKQSERVSDIVRALLTFSRRRPQEKAILGIADPIGDALEIFQARLAGGQVRVKQEVAMDIGKIRGNRNELAQVFLNLFNNASDAMPEGGEIKIRAWQSELQGQPAISVLVRDTGTGIPEELLEKVIEPFFTTKPVGKGTGLGLSISLGIIEEHSGVFRVRNYSENGNRGAEFEITLPVVLDNRVPGNKNA